jgi:hypothetical protein
VKLKLPSIRKHAEQAGRCFGDDRVNRDIAGAVSELCDVRSAFRLRKNDAVNIGLCNQLQIVLVMFAADRVVPNPPVRTSGATPKILQYVSGVGLPAWYDAVFQVENHGVGVAFNSLRDFPFAIRRYEQPASRLAH